MVQFPIEASALRDTTDWLRRPNAWDDNAQGQEFSDQTLARIQFAAALVTAIDAGVIIDSRSLRVAADLIAADQQDDGSWRLDASASIGSPATYGTALATRAALRTLRRAEVEDLAGVVARGDRWLRAVEVKTVLDAAAVVAALGLADDPAAIRQRQTCLDIIVRGQAPSGGWGAYVTTATEPFDTAVVVLALADLLEAPGLAAPTVDERAGLERLIAAGRSFLLAEQLDDGSWVETTRPPGQQSYAQYISTSLDACLSLENLIDPMSLYMKRHAPVEPVPEVDEQRLAEAQVQRFPVEHSYMEDYVNPKDALAEEKKKLTEDLSEKRRRDPPEPVRDVLWFLLHNAQLADWQADCLAIIREEAYYFAPQRMTKIINEGWATWVHSKLMTTKLLQSPEVVEYCSRHASTLASSPGQLNPYRLGYSLLCDIEDRWNRGAHGREWSECDDYRKKVEWDTGAMDGRRKIFEVRRIHSDQTFLDAFLTPEFMKEQKLYIYGKDPRTGQTVILDRDPETVKPRLLREFTNLGQPIIEVLDANYENRAELLLTHCYEGNILREDHARETLENLFEIWTRPVHLQTEMEGKEVIWSYNGRGHMSRQA